MAQSTEGLSFKHGELRSTPRAHVEKAHPCDSTLGMQSQATKSPRLLGQLA